MIKIVWSKNAKKEVSSIFQYWNDKNKSTLYSSKIKSHINLALKLILDQSKMGLSTNISGVRMKLILKNYYLIYQLTDDEIHVLQFWDVRQNPLQTKFRSN